MNRLSSPITRIQSRYDVVIVGSGYGGAIAASRLARAGRAVCVLERGKERQPGEYPSTPLEGAEELQLDLPKAHLGSRTGLFDVHVNDDISVVVGCGLGGTSLINASVSIRPDPRVFEDPRWPAALRGEGGARLRAGFDLAEKMLGANPYPESLPTPPKLTALKRSAEAMGHKHVRVPLNVTFTKGDNHAGVRQEACVLCGDCASGCNHGAKNTVLMNYLPDAKRHGAELFTEAGVRWVERAREGGWEVHYQVLNTGRETYQAETLFVAADIVILAAGSLGSTEILLRSRDAGKLTVSARLGEGFGGNGDVLGFGYNTSHEIRSVGLGSKAPTDGRPLDEGRVIGPCITGIIDMRGGADLHGDMIVAEGAIPAVISAILPAVQKAAAGPFGVNTAKGTVMAQAKRELESALGGAYRGATNQTQTYLGMCHDDSDGAMKLEQDRLRIAWPNVGKKPVFTELNQRLEDATRPLSGIFISNPLWSDALGKSLVTVHPLGGCNMADSAEGGVVDHACKVFSGSAGAAVHEGLYVCDGAVVPTALGVNPLLTISALAERCCMILAEERGFSIDYAQKGPLRDVPEERKAGIRFTESMKGWFSPVPAATSPEAAPSPGAPRVPDEAYAKCAQRGEATGSSFQFILTIASDDVEAMITDATHEAAMVGSVTAPALSSAPLVVTQGVFNLFLEDPTWSGARLMKYAMGLVSEEGHRYFFKGFKVIRESPVWELWKQNTTLFITVYEGKDDSGPVVGQGVLKILPDDFVRLLATLDVTNAQSRTARAATTVRFGRFFAGTLYDKYGGIAAPLSFGAQALGAISFDDDAAPPRKRRPLRVSAPDFFPIKASDGADLLLTRHAGGQKGPVILSYGVGASSQVFSIDTVDTNLLEYLCAEGYDVWLFDDRTSLLLPEPRAACTTDDVAQKDWPAAVAAVRAATSAASVQVVAHGLGGAMFAMAMLSGLEGVRSAVCSQLGTHLVTPRSFAPRDDDAHARFDLLVGPLYDPAALDEATLAALDEVYGSTNERLLESVAAAVRAGHVVDASGAEVYLPHLSRMAIPIRFLHGGANKAFLPESTEQAVKALGERNGAALYSRRVLEGYGHDDCLFGKNALSDVYQEILEHLEKT